MPLLEYNGILTFITLVTTIADDTSKKVFFFLDKIILDVRRVDNLQEMSKYKWRYPEKAIITNHSLPRHQK